MPPLLPSVTFLLLLASPPTLAQPATELWQMTSPLRFTVTADMPGQAREVRISPGLGLLFVFDTPVRRDGLVLEEQELFRQVSLSEDGLLLTLLPSDELLLGRRLSLTVRFADGAAPVSMAFTLVVYPQAEPQVEVHRRPRPGDSYRRELEDTQAKFQQCQMELTRERAERDKLPGLLGLLAMNQMGVEGIPVQAMARDVFIHPKETFRIERAFSYRATVKEKKVSVTRLALNLLLTNQDSKPWQPTAAQLMGQSGRWRAEVWSPEPIPPGESRQVLVEVVLTESVVPGPFLLKLWDESRTRMATLSGVTFP